MIVSLVRHRLFAHGLAVLAMLNGGVLQAASLAVPVGYTQAVGQSALTPKTCPTLVPFTGTLDFPSKYSGNDSARATLNAEAEAAYRAQTAAITAFEKSLSQQVDDAMRSGQPKALACAMQLLGQWASAKALLGTATTHTGRALRKWVLATVASSYLRLKSSRSDPLQTYRTRTPIIESWIDLLSKRVVREWPTEPLTRFNNHAYWAGWSVMAAAAVLNRQDYFDWARAVLHTATTQIDQDGFLPNELERATLAWSYHNYALQPLSQLAAFAQVSAKPPDAAEQAALQRLATRVLVGADFAPTFMQRTGVGQTALDFIDGYSFAWLEPLCQALVCPLPVLRTRDALRPLRNTRLGGALTLIYRLDLP